MKNQTSQGNFIGKRIRSARERSNLSQFELAEKLGFESATAISLIESGERGISAENLAKIGVVLKIDVNELLGKKTQAPDVIVALRADKGISDEDRVAIERIIEMAKKRRHDKRR